MTSLCPTQSSIGLSFLNLTFQLKHTDFLYAVSKLTGKGKEMENKSVYVRVTLCTPENEEM